MNESHKFIIKIHSTSHTDKFTASKSCQSDTDKHSANPESKGSHCDKRSSNPQSNGSHTDKHSTNPESNGSHYDKHFSDPKWIKTGEVCRLYGVYPTTVRKWQQDGRIKAIKTPGGQRLFDLSTIQALMDQTPPIETISTPQSTQENILYCRVSSSHQKDDLKRQRDSLQSRFPTYRVVEDVGSGLNFKRKGLQTILDLALEGNLRTVVVNSPSAKFASLTLINFFQIYRKIYGKKYTHDEAR